MPRSKIRSILERKGSTHRINLYKNHKPFILYKKTAGAYSSTSGGGLSDALQFMGKRTAGHYPRTREMKIVENEPLADIPTTSGLIDMRDMVKDVIRKRRDMEGREIQPPDGPPTREDKKRHMTDIADALRSMKKTKR